MLVLNISDNGVNDVNCDLICKLIGRNKKLIELYLFWNLITSEGSEKIFNSLLNNSNMSVLDLSWNKINSPTINLCQYLEQNLNVVHLDISNNPFQYEQILEISDSLKLNNKILGFHFANKFGYIDNRQNLILNDKLIYAQGSMIKRMSGIKTLVKN